LPGEDGGDTGGSEPGQPGAEDGSTASGTQPDGTGGTPTWDDRGKPGGGGEWETSNQIPEVPVDISGNGSGDTEEADGLPGSGDRRTSGKSGAAGELEDVLEDIDGGILAERGEIKARAGQTPGGGGSGGDRTVSGVPGNGSAASGEAGSDSGDPSALPGAPDGIPTIANAPRAPAKSSGVPRDVADARDDDIIARQLREAAMQEADPEIREKLWADYRRYKGR